MVLYRQQIAADFPAIDHLLDRVFGSDREAKPSYRYRVGPPVPGLSWVAVENSRLVGTVRYWPVRLAGLSHLLLGPLGVDPDRRNLGIGRALMRLTLERAEAGGAGAVFLVGDLNYYAPFGFRVVRDGPSMAGVDPERFLVRTDNPACLMPAAFDMRTINRNIALTSRRTG